MARQETDREDLLREATAFARRIQLALPAPDGEAFVGFRSDGSASVYFGSDPVYHFNSRGELRRAFRDGLLVKAEARRLASLQRHRVSGEVQLLRHDLSAQETAALIGRIQADLKRLKMAIEERTARVIGQVPGRIDLLAVTLRWLDGIDEIHIAASPRAG